MITGPLEGNLVTVIVPMYNAEQHIEECIRSIYRQQHGNLEVVLVDDGSTDRTREIASSIASSDDRLRLITQSNQGVSAARNAGLLVANGEWVTFVDADDVLDEQFVTSMLETGLATGAPVVFATKTFERGSQARAMRGDSWTSSSSQALERLLYPGISVGCWNKLFARSLLSANGIWFNEELEMGEGLEFCTKAARVAPIVGWTEGGFYDYRKTNMQSVTSRLTAQKMCGAMTSIRAIRAATDANNRPVTMALDYHEWRTVFLWLSVEFTGPKQHRSNVSPQLRRFLRVRGPRLVTAARLTGKERLLAAAITIFPGTVAKIAVFRRSRRMKRISTLHAKQQEAGQ